MSVNSLYDDDILVRTLHWLACLMRLWQTGPAAGTTAFFHFRECISKASFSYLKASNHHLFLRTAPHPPQLLHDIMAHCLLQEKLRTRCIHSALPLDRAHSYVMAERWGTNSGSAVDLTITVDWRIDGVAHKARHLWVNERQR